MWLERGGTDRATPSTLHDAIIKQSGRTHGQLVLTVTLAVMCVMGQWDTSASVLSYDLGELTHYAYV